MEAPLKTLLLVVSVAMLRCVLAQPCTGSCLEGPMFSCSHEDERNCDSWSISEEVFCYGFPLQPYDPCDDLNQCLEDVVYLYKAPVGGNGSCHLPVRAFEIPTSRCLYGYNGLFKNQLDASCFEAAQNLEDYIECKNSIHGATTDVYFTLEDINGAYGDVEKFTTTDCEGIPFDSEEIQFRQECRMNLTQDYLYAFMGITNDCYLQDFADVVVTTSTSSPSPSSSSTTSTEADTSKASSPLGSGGHLVFTLFMSLLTLLCGALGIQRIPISH